MSDRVEETLEVLAEIARMRAAGGRAKSASQLRLDACHVVAERRRILPTTVSDKFRRQLIPQIRGTADFDRALTEWFGKQPGRIRSALEAHAVTSEDRERIRAFFDAADGALFPASVRAARHSGGAVNSQADITVVILDPDVALAFPNATAVNDALRSLLRIANQAQRKASSYDRD